MKKIFLLLLVLANVVYSQDIVNQFDITLKSNRDVFQIVKDSTKEVNLFISDRKKVTSFLLDSKLEIKDSISGTRPEKKHKDILGYSTSNNIYTIYWSTSNKNQLFYQTFDFINKKVIGNTIEYNSSGLNEKHLQYFTINGKFYTLKLSIDEHCLKLYEYLGSDIKEFRIDTSEMKLYKSNNELSDIYFVLQKSLGEFEINGGGIFEGQYSLTKIDFTTPTTLTEAAKKRKIYATNNELLITLDFNDSKTQIIKIDLSTKKATLQEINKSIEVYEIGSDLKSNSFIIEDKIFQLIVTSKKLVLSQKDMTGNIIKEYVINENDKFSIKNSPFIRENLMGSERELETTAQFIRKIVRSNVGIAAYNLNGNYLVTIGSVSAEKSGGYGPQMGGFGILNGNSPLGSGFYVQPVNFTMNSFNNYKSRRSISTNCLFNNELIHLSDKIKDIAFDKIKNYEEKYSLYIESPTLFKLENEFIYGFYNASTHKYSFYKFAN
ncbi:hypothetical protein [Flavobacterium sp.]|uniref:hypothetical protein n=1 Tax=Flavobacterium sp. TaxID=239 RepID=UPI00374D9419